MPDILSSQNNNLGLALRRVSSWLLSLILALLVFAISVQPTLAQVAGPTSTPAPVWDQPINLSRSGAASEPRLLVSPDGRLQVFWVDQFDGLLTATYEKGKWNTPRAIPVDAKQPGTLPEFFVDPAPIFGIVRIHAFWYGAANSTTRQRPLLYSQMAFGGTVWSTPQVAAESAARFTVASLANGNLVLAYYRPLQSTSGLAGVYARQIYLNQGVPFLGSPASVYSSIYYRLVDPESSHLALTTFGTAGVMLAWDDPREPQVQFALSSNGGSTWQTQSLEFGGALNPRLVVASGIALRLWQTPGTCQIWQQRLESLPETALPGQFAFVPTQTPAGDSPAAAAEWDAPLQILFDQGTCPENDRFFALPDGRLAWLWDEGASAVTLSFYDFDQAAWSLPARWSFSFQDPESGRSVGLSNLRLVLSGERLVAAGLDEATGEVWVLPAPVEMLSATFAPVTWSEVRYLSRPDAKLSDPRQVGSPASAAGPDGVIHFVWSQLPSTSSSLHSLFYARWDGRSLSQPVEVVPGRNGESHTQPALLAAPGDELHLAWRVEPAGEVRYSRAQANQAASAGGWLPPRALAQGSAWPQLALDQQGSLYLAYVTPVNEGRGVYLAQSLDDGESWSEPNLVFDAAAAGWQMVDHPALAVDAGGGVYLAWTQKALAGELQPLKIYTAQSLDQGLTWSDPLAQSQSGVDWPRMVVVNGQLHLVFHRQVDQSLWHSWIDLANSDLAASERPSLTWPTAQRVNGFEGIQAPYGLAAAGRPAPVSDEAYALYLAAMQPAAGGFLYSSWQARRWSEVERFVLPPVNGAPFNLVAAQDRLSLALNLAAPGEGGILSAAWLGAVEAGTGQAGNQPAEARVGLFFASRLIPALRLPDLPPTATPAPTDTPAPQPLPTLPVPTATPTISSAPAELAPPVDPMVLGGGLAAIILFAILAGILTLSSRRGR